MPGEGERLIQKGKPLYPFCSRCRVRMVVWVTGRQHKTPTSYKCSGCGRIATRGTPEYYAGVELRLQIEAELLAIMRGK